LALGLRDNATVKILVEWLRVLILWSTFY